MLNERNKLNKFDLKNLLHNSEKNTVWRDLAKNFILQISNLKSA